jgi:predicted nucleic acid-binding protein
MLKLSLVVNLGIIFSSVLSTQIACEGDLIWVDNFNLVPFSKKVLNHCPFDL